MTNYWYAVMTDADDQDWGTGSYDLEEAKRKVRENRDIYPDGYIAVIEETSHDAVCVDEIHEID